MSIESIVHIWLRIKNGDDNARHVFFWSSLKNVADYVYTHDYYSLELPFETQYAYTEPLIRLDCIESYTLWLCH
jgi:hypothetical protein